MQEKINDVKQIITLFEQSNLDSLELEVDNFKIKLKSKDDVRCNLKKTEKEKVSKGRYIESPLVGTFYTKPNPSAKSFITVGQKIKKGDSLFIIEAMKVMNEIKSDQEGIIEEILVKDGTLVEFGTPIIKLGD